MPSLRSHNYAHDHVLNMWFVLATESAEALQQALAEIEQQTGYAVYNMPKIAEYLAGLRLDALSAMDYPEECLATLDATDRRIVLATQCGLPVTERPYHALAERLGLSALEVMARIERMLRCGVIRRVAAAPNHYALGYWANGMSVWDVPDEQADELGRRIGSLEFVSHCYRRPRHLPLWPYNLFAMVHGRDRAEVEQKVVEIAALLGGACRAHNVLYSTRILKNTGPRISA
jgi:siroheme decarboxylase